MIDFNEYAKKIYAQNVEMGWWDNPDRNIYTTLMLVITEIAEATEGERKNLMDDHLPHRKMGEVELADALIRTLDLGGRFGWAYYCDVITPDTFISKEVEIGEKHFYLCKYIAGLGSSVCDDDNYSQSVSYSCLIDALINTSNSMGYDIKGAMIEKLEYNKNRADHKRENRAKKNGKKF